MSEHSASASDGVSKPEIILCRKRYIARQAYHAIVADLGQQVSAKTTTTEQHLTIYTTLPSHGSTASGVHTAYC